MSLVHLDRNRRSLWTGISGHFGPESAIQTLTAKGGKLGVAVRAF
jgi:hypothetical protein